MPHAEELEQLVHEALNLVVRARKLDEAVIAKELVEAGRVIRTA